LGIATRCHEKPDVIESEVLDDHSFFPLTYYAWDAFMTAFEEGSMSEFGLIQAEVRYLPAGACRNADVGVWRLMVVGGVVVFGG
jgi:hypothetical protein